MKVYSITRLYPDIDGSHIVASFLDKLRANRLLEIFDGGLEGKSIYKIEEIEVIE